MNKTILLALIAMSTSLMAQQPPQEARPSMSDAFMQQLDTDKDGKVTKAEFLKPYEAQFAHIDKNQDGSIDKAEIDAFSTQMQKHMQQRQPAQ